MRVRISAPQIIIFFLIIFACLAASCSVWLFLILMLMLVAVFACINNLSEHIFLFLFVIAFFTFLLGGQVVYEFFDYPMAYDYTGDEYKSLNIKLLISLFCILIGYIAGKSKKQRQMCHDSLATSKNTQKIKKLSKYSFYVFLIPYCMTLAEAIMVVKAKGYLEYYNYVSSLPTVVNETADLFNVSFCLFLATFPTKEESRCPVKIYLLLSILTLFVGRRLYFVSQTMLLLGYLLMRNREGETWISKKKIVIIICAVPFLIVMLYAVKYLRYGRTIKATSLAEAFLSFFQQQGFSANLIMLEQRYEAMLTDDLYSFFSILRFLRINPISQYVLKLNYVGNYTGSRENMALHSGSFAMMISYLTMPTRFLQGYGTGSCYIAELFHDFGYWGIIFGNFIYGFVIRKISYFSDSVLKNTIFLLMFQKILITPRYFFDYPFFVVFSYSFWAYIAFIYLVAYMAHNRSLRIRKQ